MVANAYGKPFVYDYPKNLSWQDYPFVQAARYKRLEATQFKVVPKPLTGAGPGYVPELLDYATLSKGQAAISCTDACSNSVAAAHRLRRYLEQLGKISEWQGTYTFWALDDICIKRALANPLTEPDEKLACARFDLKSNFEYSFLVNAAGLLTRCYQAAGGLYENPIFCDIPPTA